MKNKSKICIPIYLFIFFIYLINDFPTPIIAIIIEYYSNDISSKFFHMVKKKRYAFGGDR